MAEIPGIDYNRITQKAGGGYKSYPVELHMGDLTFFGELHGELGLSYEELNQIIRDTLPGSEWPDNEFTRLVPAPDFKLMTSFTDEDEFTAAFQSLEVSQIKTYAQKVKKSGFTIDAEEESQEVYGIVVYTYTAYNEEGYCVQISFASGNGAVAISR